jgi:hypothetical protein
MDYEKEYKRLQDDLHWKEVREREQREQEYEERERQRRARREEEIQAQFYAETWNEAFNKALPRLRKEASEEVAFASEDPTFDPWFPMQVEQHEAARQFLREEEAAIYERIVRIRERAERLVAELEQQARNKAADRVDGQFGEETIIGVNLRNNDIDAVVNW